MRVGVENVFEKRANYLFLHVSGGIGWMVQKNAPLQMGYLRPRIEMLANAWCGDIAVGYNLKLSERVSIRLKASCIIGYPLNSTISSIYSETPFDGLWQLDMGDYCNNMNTFNFTAGFLFHK